MGAPPHDKTHHKDNNNKTFFRAARRRATNFADRGLHHPAEGAVRAPIGDRRVAYIYLAIAWSVRPSDPPSHRSINPSPHRRANAHAHTFRCLAHRPSASPAHQPIGVRPSNQRPGQPSNATSINTSDTCIAHVLRRDALRGSFRQYTRFITIALHVHR